MQFSRFEICFIKETVFKNISLSKLNSIDYVLLRKEVIQPHLPIRLPCYDFTLVTDFTFDRFLPPRGGLDHGLRAPPPASMV